MRFWKKQDEKERIFFNFLLTTGSGDAIIVNVAERDAAKTE